MMLHFVVVIINAIVMMIIPIVVTVLGIVTDVRSHASKAPELIRVTLVGIVILANGQIAYW